MKTVHEVSKCSGVSIRALHHYDSIGLLKPTAVTESGYRLYGDEALGRLKAILMYRELGFALKDIAAILDSPDFELREALAQHIELLKLQRAHIDGLITEAEKLMKGESADFTAFDKSDMDKYADEVKARWGNTAAYRECEEKQSTLRAAEKKNAADVLMAELARLGAMKEQGAASPEVQAAVRALQTCITDNFYTCTRELLASLGEMYASDERFRESIDSVGGAGSAEFLRDAIRVYCKK